MDLGDATERLERADRAREGTLSSMPHPFIPEREIGRRGVGRVLEAWEAAGSPDWHGWQQEQVLATAQGVRDSVLAARPSTTISASVWGMYEDLWDWNTSEGLHDHDQDSLLHVEAGAVDVIVPMIYWPLTDPPGEYTDYRTLVEFFGAEVAPGRFWAGLEADYDNFAEVEAEIEAARLAGAAGVSVFAWTYVEDRGWWDDFGDGPFSQPASAP